jgi:cellulose synthase/poly-beta-1,6-N-acetylglucosamine synthase-like glycosyltransferase
VSVILPVRNESGFIERSLGAAAAQDYPTDRMEVVVVDGMSVDETRDLVQATLRRHPSRGIRMLDNPGRILSTGFNIGFRTARGDIIVLLGGHTEISPDYVRRCVAHLASREFDCVGGSVETVAETQIGRAIAVAMSSRFGVGGVAFRLPLGRRLEVDTVAFGAYRRAALERCGPFDEEMVRNQDDEYNYRLRDLGGRILLAPDVRSRYYSRGNLASLWRQYFQYGYWKVRVLQKHPRQLRTRHIVPAAFVVSLLASALLAVAIHPAIRALGVVTGAYVLTSITATALSVRRTGWRQLPLMPVVFATLHLSYGLGFLGGLVRFRHEWRATPKRVATS